MLPVDEQLISDIHKQCDMKHFRPDTIINGNVSDQTQGA